jgi:tRNA threonylcarbamoyladenosine biosynthesis protein TsaB
MSEIGLVREQIELLAVVSGPGSFTGLRIGMAGLLGWGVTAGIPVQPVDTFTAMMATLGNVDSPYLLAIHSRGEEFYLQYSESPGHQTNPSVGRVESILESLREDCLVCGSGAERFVRLAEKAGNATLRLAPTDLRVPDMIAVCREAEELHMSNANPSYEIEPYYMTLSQAEIKFDRNANRDS